MDQRVSADVIAMIAASEYVNVNCTPFDSPVLVCCQSMIREFKAFLTPEERGVNLDLVVAGIEK